MEEISATPNRKQSNWLTAKNDLFDSNQNKLDCLCHNMNNTLILYVFYAYALQVD